MLQDAATGATYDIEKLHQWAGGWFSGAGHHETLVAAQRNLASLEVPHSDEATQKLRQAWQEVLEPAKTELPPELHEALKRTAILLTIQVRAGMRTVIYGPGYYGDHLRPIALGQVYVLAPFDTDADAVARIVREHGGVDREDDTVAVASAVAHTVHAFTEISTDVSDRIDLGVHPMGGPLARLYGRVDKVSECRSLLELSRYSVRPGNRDPGAPLDGLST